VSESRIAPRNVREQAIEFRLDPCVALANGLFQARPIKDLDAATAVADKSGPLQIPGGLGNPFAPHVSSGSASTGVCVAPAATTSGNPLSLIRASAVIRVSPAGATMRLHQLRKESR